MKNTISAKELLLKLDNEDNLVIIDCRFDLIDRDYGIKAYKKGHIKGSFLLDIDKDLSSPVQKHGGKNPLQDPSVLKKKLEKMGIDNNTLVVIYDDGDLNGACRLFFQIKHLGIDNVVVLDGGISSFTHHGGTLEEKINIPNSTSKKINMKINNNLIASMDYVKSKLYNPDTIIIDCRENRRYQGIIEPAYSKAGHIPSAKNYYFKDLLKDNFKDGSFKDISFLRSFFLELENYKEVILYCGSGVSACVNSLVLRELGIEHKVYIGSFSDWISYDSNSIKTGEE